MAFESSSEDEAFVVRLTHDSHRWIREDISHVLLMLRKLSSVNYNARTSVGERYLERYKTFIHARKAVDNNHPMRKIILKRMAAMNAPLEELINFLEDDNGLRISESQTTVNISSLRQRRGIIRSALTSDDFRVFSLIDQVGRDLNLVHIYTLMHPSKYDQTTVKGYESQLKDLANTVAQQLRGCKLVLLVMGSFIILSLFLGIFFTVHKEYGYSMGDSFTLGGYIIAVGALVCSFLMWRHLPTCKCWKDARSKKRRRSSDESLDNVELGLLRGRSHSR